MAAIDVASLQAQRWFGGKGATIASVRTVDELRLTGRLQLEIIEVAYAAGRAPERYVLAEGIEDAEGAVALLDLMRGGKMLATRNGTLRGERFGSGLHSLPARPAVRKLSAEQSNTSLVFDDLVIMKVIRKLEHGVNPELELGAFLGKHGFLSTPPLLGALSLQGAVVATLAVAHRFVKVDADGWSYALGQLRQGLSLGDDVERLGARIGELHAALASDPVDPAFAPEPIRQEDLARWSAKLLIDLERTVASCAASVPGLALRQGSLQARIRRLAQLAPSGVRIRQHGDLHLGQVLRSGGQWLIFDFEGEPARTLAERREKHCPLKDVAGMLRSFAYASATVDGSPERLQESRAAFLRGYRSTAAHLLPVDEAAAAVLLDSLELEKLLYELRYEVGHRPDWVRIPARDLLAEASP